MKDKDSNPRFAELLEYHLNLKLQKFVGKGAASQPEMYGMIKEVVFSVFSKSSHNPVEVTKEWISQKYYESIKFSSAKIITGDPDTWDNRTSPVYSPVKVERIPTQDLRYIAPLFNEMTFYGELERELALRG